MQAVPHQSHAPALYIRQIHIQSQLAQTGIVGELRFHAQRKAPSREKDCQQGVRIRQAEAQLEFRIQGSGIPDRHLFHPLRQVISQKTLQFLAGGAYVPNTPGIQIQQIRTHPDLFSHRTGMGHTDGKTVQRINRTQTLDFGVLQQDIPINGKRLVPPVVHAHAGPGREISGIPHQMQGGQIDIAQIQIVTGPGGIGTEIHNTGQVEIEIRIMANHIPGKKILFHEEVEIQRIQSPPGKFQALHLTVQIIGHRGEIPAE